MPQAEAVSLTPKQRQVLDLLEGGASVSEIAKRMKISEAGVYSHVRSIRRAGGSLPAERFETNGTPAASNRREEPSSIQGVRQQLEAALADIDRERERVKTAIRALAA